MHHMYNHLNPTGILVGIVIGFFIGYWFRKKEESSSLGTNNVPSQNESSFGDWGEYKMVLVVRQDLGMGKGKAAAQCCHAAVDVYNRTKKVHPQWLANWEKSACPKVALKCPDEEALEALASHARVLGLDTSVIRDAGRTQIPSGSKTVLGIGPAPVDAVNKVTGHLKLF
ncbi:peptidyl-tRNA hydrolase 2, mitochondrial-like [Hydractinia symbiolongicarpus]|uniref:peptidyl-tRNA hydrolase 2, mitochondrial-like n=1 Tax=Hydractinia symbiolongicarpus TaxID=13093 RepID=UPI00254FAC8D|nr:peptidyl-tRNA hydrolase 2, mitochondrial-like [Hydractinia symbiolongicarpus]